MTVGVQDENVPLLPGKTTPYGWRSLDRLEKLYKRNTGFLLIAAAQLGFSASDVCVQELNRLDHPVPTLQVGLTLLNIWPVSLTSSSTADRCSYGMLTCLITIGNLMTLGGHNLRVLPDNHAMGKSSRTL